MREFKNEQITFYCNCAGELHIGGKQDLKSVEELPLPLQKVYETLWTDFLTAPCYIAYVDDKPGLLFMALYDDEECELQSIPTERDAKIAALREKCERLEKLTKQISPEAEIGIGEDTGFDTELVMFIPTETVQPLDALRLLFLMNEYALSDPPDKVEWDNSQLIAFAQRYLPESDVRTEMIVQLEK